MIGVLAGVALLALALFALLRYRRRRRGGGDVPPYEPEMQYHGQDPNAAAAGANGAGGVNGVNTVGSGDGTVDKKLYPGEGQIASEMDAEDIPQEMPEEPQRWHELESPPATT